MLNIIYAVSKLLTVFVQYEDHELVVTFHVANRLISGVL